MKKIEDIIVYRNRSFYCAFPSVVCLPDGELIVGPLRSSRYICPIIRWIQRRKGLKLVLEPIFSDENEVLKDCLEWHLLKGLWHYSFDFRDVPLNDE